MEYQQKLLLLTGLLVAAALYIALTGAPAPVPDSTEAEKLLMKNAAFGKGMGDYAYSYSDISDGYKTTYTLISHGSERLIDIQNPLSTKKVYFLGNDTVFCIRYPVNESCTSVEGDSEMKNYVDFARTKFFNDTLIDRSKNNLEYLLKEGYLSLAQETENETVGTRECTRVRYVIDYSNLTLDEAAKFSIGSDSPKAFRLSVCLDGDGATVESTLDYSDNKGTNHSRVTRMVSIKNFSAAIESPTLQGDAVSVFRREREQQVKLATCHTDKSGAAREECVADLALILKRKDLCDLAGSLRDRCLVSIVPLTKDQTICPAVSGQSFRDDCYIELAGALKDSSFCQMLKNESKNDLCQSVSKPKEAGNSSVVDINDFLDMVDGS